MYYFTQIVYLLLTSFVSPQSTISNSTRFSFTNRTNLLESSYSIKSISTPSLDGKTSKTEIYTERTENVNPGMNIIVTTQMSWMKVSSLGSPLDLPADISLIPIASTMSSLSLLQPSLVLLLNSTVSTTLPLNAISYNKTAVPQISTPIATSTPIASAVNSTTTRSPATTLKPKRKLFIADIFLTDVESEFDKNFLYSTFQVALNHINRDPTILTDYELVGDNVDKINGFNGIDGLDYSMKLLTRQDTPVYGIIGPVNTGTIRFTNQVLKTFGIYQMNFAATDPMLPNAEERPNLFSVVPSTRSINIALTQLMVYRSWRRASIMFGTDLNSIAQSDIERTTAEYLASIFRENSIEHDVYEFRHNVIRYDPSAPQINENIYNELLKIKEKDYRIIILAIAEETLPYIVCQAKKLDMINQKYYWVVINQKTFKVWDNTTLDDRYTTNCTFKELTEATRSIVFTDNELPRRDNKRIISNKTAAEITDEIIAYRKTIERASFVMPAYNKISYYVYDCTWSLALAYDKAIKTIPNFIEDYDAQHKNYHNFELFKKMQAIMENISFSGITGEVKFDDDKRGRYASMIFMHYDKGNYTEFGYFNYKNETFSVDKALEEKITGWKLPRDGSTLIQNPRIFNVATMACIWLITFLAVFLALWFLFTNLRFRKVVYIKMSSPNINNAIIFGSMLCYIAVIIYGLDSRIIKKDKIPLACDFIVVCLTYGYTLAYGALFSKTWRIYRIFTSAERSLQVVVIRDIHLFGVIFLLMLIDTIIIVTWMVMSPYELFVEVVTESVNKDTDTIAQDVIYRCTCKNQTEFGVAIFIYKGLLLVFGLFLAWETRKISVAAINDSKEMGMAVYSTAVLASIGAICSFSLHQTTLYTESYITFAIFTILCTTITLCLVFVPKVKMILTKFEDPNFRNGRPILSEESNHTNRNYSNSFNRSEGDYATISRKTTVDSTGNEYNTMPRKNTQDGASINRLNGQVKLSSAVTEETARKDNLISSAKPYGHVTMDTNNDQYNHIQNGHIYKDKLTLNSNGYIIEQTNHGFSVDDETTTTTSNGSNNDTLGANNLKVISQTTNNTKRAKEDLILQ